MPVNELWHRKHPMPRRPSRAERLAWHREHAARCGCRPIPAKLAPLLKAAPATRAKAPPKRPASAAATRADHKRGRCAAPAAQALLGRVRAICLALPGSAEVEAWGHPTFRVGGKIFASFGGDDSGGTLGVKTTPDLQAALVGSDARFAIAAYVGKHGWVSMTLKGTVDWNEVDALVRGSYRLIAPARLARAV
jgi:predicted DNA-binding protein (MmcQ/YjbR family)